MRTSHVAPNLLQREFRAHGPWKILLTDITYLTYGSGQRAYMVTILDAYTKQLRAYEVSQSLKIDFVPNQQRPGFPLHQLEIYSNHPGQSSAPVHVQKSQLLGQRTPGKLFRAYEG